MLGARPESNTRPERNRRGAGRAEADFALTDEHRMLLDIRDTLYEGSWSDFEHDLVARMNREPHVFETVSASPDMPETIRDHLAMIEVMRKWEARHGRVLRGSVGDAPNTT